MSRARPPAAVTAGARRGVARWLRGLPLLLVLLGLAAPARAAESPRERAERLAREGASLLEQGDAAQAVARLEEAYRLGPSLELLFQLGRGALASGRDLPAADLWRRYQEEAGESLPEERRALIARHLGRAFDASEVTVSSDSGALVIVDGRLVGALPLSQPLLLAGGAHSFRLERGGRKVETQVTLPARRQAELRATFAPPAALLTLIPTVLVVEGEGRLPPALTAGLQRAVAAALSQERAVPIAPTVRDAAQRRPPALPRCAPSDDPCLLRLAERLDAQLVLRLQIESEPAPAGEEGEGGDLAVTVLDVAARVPAAALRRALTAEPSSALEAPLRQLLRQALTRPQGRLRVESEPPAAAVLLDGVALGATPLSLPAFLGPRRLELRLADHEPYQTEVVISEGAETALRVPLRAVPRPPAAPVAIAKAAPALAPPARWRRPLAISLLALGGLAVIGGVVAFGLDGYQTCALADVGRCPQELNGWPTGAALVSLGGAALVSGGLLLLWERHPARQ